MYKMIFSFLFSLAIVSCGGGAASIKESDFSLTDTRKALVKLYGEPRALSQNGREFTTQFMDKKGRVLESAKKAKERRYAHIKILGDRRPYDITVDVTIQSQIDENLYDDVGDDDELAENVTKAIKRELLKSLENRNIIDDFNAF